MSAHQHVCPSSTAKSRNISRCDSVRSAFAIFEQFWYRTHIKNATTSLFEKKNGIQMTKWPAMSHDANSINIRV